MALFSKTIAEITIDFYGQKRRNKTVSNVQVYYTVSINPYGMDPNALAQFYSKFLFKSADIAVLPDHRILFWGYLNESYKNILNNKSNIFSIWPRFVDVAPIASPQSGKPNTTIKLQLLDNSKTTYKISEGSVGIYYVPLAVIAFMQYVIDTLTPGQYAIFYDQLKQHINYFKSTLKKPTPYKFDLWDLLPIEQTNQPPQINEPVQNVQNTIKFCSSCGNKLTLIDGINQKFCGLCGKQIK